MDIKACMLQIDELRAAEEVRMLSREEYTLLDESRQLLLRQTVAIKIVGEFITQSAHPSNEQRQYEKMLRRGTSSSEAAPTRPPAVSSVDQFVMFELLSPLYKIRGPGGNNFVAPAPAQRIDSSEDKAQGYILNTEIEENRSVQEAEAETLDTLATVGKGADAFVQRTVEQERHSALNLWGHGRPFHIDRPRRSESRDRPFFFLPEPPSRERSTDSRSRSAD
jgi:hypothetical protein